MRPVAMGKLELYVLKSDIDSVLARLGALACFQPCPSVAAKRGESSPYGETRHTLDDIRDKLGLAPLAGLGDSLRLPGPEDEALVDSMALRVGELADQEVAMEARIGELKEALGEASAFADLKLPFRELDHLSFLALRIGRLDPGELASVRETLGDRALLLPLGTEDQILAMASKKGRFALDTELKRAGFKAQEFAPDFEGVPPALIPGLKAELDALEATRAGIEARKAALRAELEPLWARLTASYAIALAIQEVKSGFESTSQAYRLEGWVPRDLLPSLLRDLKALTQDRIGLRVYRPEELESVRTGAEQVPVLLRHRPFVQSFNRLVCSYGAPLYGTIDPTPIVAFFFVVLFAIMFGDLGQGLVIALVGLVLTKGWIKALGKYRQFGPIFLGVGGGSMVMGLLVGSVFSNDKVLEAPTRALTTALLGRPMDRLITVMPSSGSMDKLFAFFGFTLGIGVVLNSIGLIINMINKWRLHRRGEALFGKTGLAGALFFWWAIGLALRVVLGAGPAWFDILGFGLPLLGVVLADPLIARLDGGGEAPEGGFALAIKGIVELLESVSYYFSGTLSFLRVGAFALSHAVLSFIVFAMGDLVRLRAPGGLFWEIVIVVIGNLVILVLEGMIVAIQVVRLNYYEFFSKFLTDIGVEFSPFHFVYRKE